MSGSSMDWNLDLTIVVGKLQQLEAPFLLVRHGVNVCLAAGRAVVVARTCRQCRLGIDVTVAVGVGVGVGISADDGEVAVPVLLC